MKKKIVTLLLTVVLAITVSACGNTKNTLSTENNIEQSNDTDTAYQNILDDYTQKLKDATLDLIDEFNTEAKEKTGDINSLSEILTSKTEQLAVINTEGIEKMATLMNENGSDYKIYEKWSTKLNDIYIEQAKLISDAYMTASTGLVSSLNTEEKPSIDKDATDSKENNADSKEEVPDINNNSIETDLEILTRAGHPTYYGSVEASHTIWSDVEKDKIIFGDEYTKFGDKTILSMSAYRNSDLIRGIYICFSNFEQTVTFDIEDVLPIIASYMPYDVMDKYYQYMSSELLVPDDDNTLNREKYYIISYKLNDDAKTNNEHEYSGSIDVIITTDKDGKVNNFSVGFGTPRWMSSLDTNNYHQDYWECDLYNFKN